MTTAAELGMRFVGVCREYSRERLLQAGAGTIIEDYSDRNAVFDAIEAARVEALGAKAMEGVRANLSHALSMRMRSDPIARALAVDEVPLSSAVGLLVRERLTGEAPPEVASNGLNMVREWIEEKGGADLDALGLAIDDQAAFPTIAQKLLADLELARAHDAFDPNEDRSAHDSDPEEG